MTDWADFEWPIRKRGDRQPAPLAAGRESGLCKAVYGQVICVMGVEGARRDRASGARGFGTAYPVVVIGCRQS